MAAQGFLFRIVRAWPRWAYTVEFGGRRMTGARFRRSAAFDEAERLLRLLAEVPSHE